MQTNWTITDFEMNLAVQEKCRSIQRHGNTGCYARTREQNLIIGAMAEIAVSNYLNVPFVSNFGDETRTADVFGYQVKATTYAPGSMTSHPNKMPKGIYISCLVTLPNKVKIVGWSTHRYMWREMYYNKIKTPTPCYLMKPENMFDLEMLPETKALYEYRAS